MSKKALAMPVVLAAGIACAPLVEFGHFGGAGAHLGFVPAEFGVFGDAELLAALLAGGVEDGFGLPLSDAALLVDLRAVAFELPDEAVDAAGGA